MFHNFGYDISDLLKDAENIRYKLRHPYVGTEHLLLAILNEDNKVSRVCRDFGLTYDNFYQKLVSVIGQASKEQELNLYTPMLKHILEVAINEAQESNKGKVSVLHLTLAMLEEGDGVAVRLLVDMGIEIYELYDVLKESCMNEKKKKNLEIMKIGVLLTNRSRKSKSLIGRDLEVEEMIETLLRKSKNNPLLIGKAGVGKTAIVEELARRILDHQVPYELQDMDIYELEMGALVAGTKYRGEFEERLTKIIREVVANKHIIIFIDEIHAMVNAGGAEGAICAADILKPYLARGELKVIGATTLSEYHEYIENDKALDRRFEKIVVDEPDKKTMLRILKHIKPVYENYYHISLSNDNLEDLYNYADKYIFKKCNPDKTIDLLDSVCARIKIKNSLGDNNRGSLIENVVKKKEKYLQEGNYNWALESAKMENKLRNEKSKDYPLLEMKEEDIVEVIEQKMKMKIVNNKNKMIKELKGSLEENILGQDKVINDLVFSLSSCKGNALSFLLVGGSGVGKTQTVKLFSDCMKTKLLRIDMSEYNLPESVNRLIGSPAGYVGYGKGYVFRQLLDNPYTTVLFDEIEKAHPKVLNLLLQILDEGFITDTLGNKIRFDYTYIFLTSNINVHNNIGFASSLNNQLDSLLSKELMGRIDTVLLYNNISREVAMDYISKNLKNSDVSAEELLEQSDIEKYGLRNLRNLIMKYNKRLVNNS